MAMRRMMGVVVAMSVLGLGGCFSYSVMPTYTGSAFRMMIAAETRLRGLGDAMNEEDVQKEVDRWLALRPGAPAPSKVLLFEVPSSGKTKIESARKLLQLRKETAQAMKSSLEQAGLFEQVDFLPELYLPSSAPVSLKALRIAAARAHADGLLIYSTEAGYEYEPNALSVLYATIVGAFLAPGSRGSAMAVSKAVLLDVKTGYVYRVLEAYGERSKICPVAFLDEEELEFEARKKALTGLAAVAAAKVKELAAADK